MKNALKLLMMLVCCTLANAQNSGLPLAGAKLPLVTAGEALGWVPEGDEAFFELDKAAWIRLSVASPSVSEQDLGDAVYGDDMVSSSFSLFMENRLLASASYERGPADRLELYDGPAAAGRYTLRSEVDGRGKNVYDVRLESSEASTLKAHNISVNASAESWQDALSFELDTFEACQLELYDGDGPGELQAQLILPSGYVRSLNVSPELGNITEPLPRLKGLYTLQLRLPSERYQNSNSVRLGLRCADALVPLSLAPPLGLESSPITVPLPDVRAEVAAPLPAPPAPPTTPPPATPEASAEATTLPETADITLNLSRDLSLPNLLRVRGKRGRVPS